MSLQSKTVPELRNIAADKGIAIPVDAKKNDIIELIENHQPDLLTNLEEGEPPAESPAVPEKPTTAPIGSDLSTDDAPHQASEDPLDKKARPVPPICPRCNTEMTAGTTKGVMTHYYCKKGQAGCLNSVKVPAETVRQRLAKQKQSGLTSRILARQSQATPADKEQHE